MQWDSLQHIGVIQDMRMDLEHIHRQIQMQWHTNMLVQEVERFMADVVVVDRNGLESNNRFWMGNRCNRSLSIHIHSNDWI